MDDAVLVNAFQPVEQALNERDSLWHGKRAPFPDALPETAARN